MIVLVSLQRTKQKKAVIIVSLDGFRKEYLARGLTPTLQVLSDNGITTEYLLPVFPSITFPNHYSIATGLYPESHGIVSNHFYDSELKKTFDYSNDTTSKQSWWWKGEPIWKTVQKFGISSGVIMWPGSEAHGLLPDFYVPYSKMGMIQKCDQIIKWYENYNIQLYMMYVPEVDQVGHEYGVDSIQMNQTLSKVDNGILYLLHQLSSRSLEWDILVVSDHGMTNTSPDRLIFLDDIIDVTKTKIYEAGPFMMIYPNNKSENNLFYEKLHKSNSNFSVWNHETLPTEYHYLHKSRVGPIILQAKLGFVLITRTRYNGTGHAWPLGFHGYPSEDSDMHALFLAHGPSFMKGKQIASFPNVEIYQLLSYLVGVTPSAHNGTDTWMAGIKTVMNENGHGIMAKTLETAQFFSLNSVKV